MVGWHPPYGCLTQQKTTLLYGSAMIDSTFLMKCEKWQTMKRTSDEDNEKFDDLGERLSHVALGIFANQEALAEGLEAEVDGCSYFAAVTGLKKRLLTSECVATLKRLAAGSDHFNVSTMAPLVVYAFEKGLISRID